MTAALWLSLPSLLRCMSFHIFRTVEETVDAIQDMRPTFDAFTSNFLLFTRTHAMYSYAYTHIHAHAMHMSILAGQTMAGCWADAMVFRQGQ